MRTRAAQHAFEANLKNEYLDMFGWYDIALTFVRKIREERLRIDSETQCRGAAGHER